MSTLNFVTTVTAIETILNSEVESSRFVSRTVIVDEGQTESIEP